MLTTLLMATVGFRELRIEIGGLAIPLHLIPVLFAIPRVLPAVRKIPSRIRLWGLIFFVLFALSVVRHGSELGDLVKMTASAFTILVVALLVRNKGDFLIGALAFTFAEIVINARGLQGGFVDYVGYEPLRGIANKNAFSLYALPAALVSGFVLLHFRQSLRARALHALSILSTAFILFSGANRSGWAGLALVGVMLAAQTRRWSALGAIIGLGVGAYVALTFLGTTSTFEYRVEQTTSGYESDNLRENLVINAFEIALENPVLGVTPQQLPYELAKRAAAEGDVVDPHNFLAYVVGGSGFLTLMALVGLGLVVWQRPRAGGGLTVNLAHDLQRMMVVLFIFRGLFSREVFFVAAFPIAFGLALGLVLVAAEADPNWSLTLKPSA